MSEGINFSDHLARCVVVVGLPYPNRNDPVLQQKMDFLDSLKPPKSNPTPKPTNQTARSPGEAYYQQLCMRAVNQSIGRTIRHKDDFGAIVLLDERYSTRAEIRPLLPKWIRNRLLEPQRFGQAVGSTAKFFAAQRRKRKLSSQVAQ